MLTVVFGVRNTGDAKVQAAVKAAGGATRAATVKDAAADAEVVVLATPWGATQDAIKAAGSLSGKIVIDATNCLSTSPPSTSHGAQNSMASSTRWPPWSIFWEDWTQRVNQAIETEFSGELIFRLKVKRPLIHKFKPMVKLVEWAAADLEATGELPRFTLSASTPSATDRPQYEFRKLPYGESHRECASET